MFYNEINNELFKISVTLTGYMGYLYPSRDVYAFYAAIVVWCKEPD